MKKFIDTFIICTFILALTACGKQSADTPTEKSKKEMKKTVVTVTQVTNAPIEMTEETIGSLEGFIDPTIASEVAARLISINVSIGDTVKKGQLIATLDAGDFGMQRKEAQAEVARIKAQMDNQEKTVERNQALVDKNFISQTAVDNDIAQKKILSEQLRAAKARISSINHNGAKAKIYAPVSGTIEKRLVSKGDFLRVGDPIVQIVSKQKLRAHLPFPEHLGAQLKKGLTIRLSTPTASNMVETTIKELKPMITADNRTIDVIADVDSQAGWQPGASVRGTVVLDTLDSAMMIPEQSLILRPAGEVVYVVRDNIAYQSVVKSGLRQNGLIEIIDGLNTGDNIVVDGAGFLTDKAPVTISSDSEQ